MHRSLIKCIMCTLYSHSLLGYELTDPPPDADSETEET